jgi:hypothetical protein
MVAVDGSVQAAHPLFGHSGYHPAAMRVGGISRNRSAVKVAMGQALPVTYSQRWTNNSGTDGGGA